jgi:peroxiredoxin
MVEDMGCRKKMFLAALALAMLFCMFHSRAEAELKYIGVNVGDPAPDFVLKTLGGKPVRLSSYQGKKVVLLDFWATWCNVCKKELPRINSNYKKYRDQGYEVLSIVLNASDANGVRKIKKQKKLEYPILLDSDWKVSKKYGLEGPIPVKVVVDGKGIIRFTHFGEFPHGENEIPYVVEELLTELPQNTASEK